MNSSLPSQYKCCGYVYSGSSDAKLRSAKTGRIDPTGAWLPVLSEK